MKKILQFFQKLRKPDKEEKPDNEIYGYEGCGSTDCNNDCCCGGGDCACF